MNPRTPSEDFKAGVRASVTWLHEEARRMNDPHARAVLNSAALHLSQRKAGVRLLVPTSPDWIGTDQ